jgi:diguanylate cyclase (GGDEF)-like protein/PAS domain S-box-containing protein
VACCGFSFRLALTGAVGLLASALLCVLVLIMQHRGALETVSGNDLAGVTSQSGLEMARLEAAISARQVPGSGVTRDEVAARYESVRRSIAELKQSDAAAVLEQVGPLIEHIDQPGTAGRALQLLLPLTPEVLRLTKVPGARGAQARRQRPGELVFLQRLFAGLLGALLACLFGLAGFLARQNRMLKRTHTEVQNLVDDLQRTSIELAEANRRVEQSMAEAQLHNQILRARDMELHIQNARFDAALNNMSQALCLADSDQRLIECNVRFLELFGLSRVAVRPGASVSEVFGAISRSGRYDSRMVESVRVEQEVLAATGRAGKFFQEDNEGRALAVSHQPMEDGGWVATYEDISERRRAEAQISFMAHHDALTGLPNRLLFRERMEAALVRLNGTGEGLAVLCLDLDYFKDVNDTLGHPAGDALLEAVAGRLRGCIRESDLVARLGGDEFAVLQCSGNQPDDAEMLARRIVETLNKPYQIDEQPAVVGTSIGIAVAPESGTSADVLLKCADMALYRAKAEGRGKYRFFQEEMDAEIQERRAIEIDLREALSRGEFEVFYQPLFELLHGGVSGFEALLRWRHPQRGMIPPSQFISIAEDFRLIAPIGEWVLRRACQDAIAWPDRVKVAVNLSPMQLHSENVVEQVKQALATAGLPAGRLELEITESALLNNNEPVFATLHRLRELGVRIALDDFGTGYSSLSYLQRFPFDKIKVDQSFVREIRTRPDCLAIVQSITGLAQQLGMTTTAEGVETTEQLAAVREAGCTEVQGFLLGRPMPQNQLSIVSCELSDHSEVWAVERPQRLEHAAVD